MERRQAIDKSILIVGNMSENFHIGAMLLAASRNLGKKSYRVNTGYKIPFINLYSLPWKIISRLLCLREIKNILANRQVLHTLQKHAVDLVLVVSIIPLNKNIFDFCQKNKVLIANYLIDDPFATFRKIKKIEKKYIETMDRYDVIFSTKKRLLSKLSKRGYARKSKFLPVGYDKNIFRPLYDISENYPDVVFVGDLDIERIKFLEEFQNCFKGTFAIFGGSVDNISTLRGIRQPWAFGDKYCKILTNSKLAIGLLKINSTDDQTSRTYEIPACDGTGIFMDSPDHRGIFKGLPEYAFFKTPDDLAQKCNFLLKHPALRKKLQKQEAARVLKGKNSYEDRLIQILKYIYSKQNN